MKLQMKAMWREECIRDSTHANGVASPETCMVKVSPEYIYLLLKDTVKRYSLECILIHSSLL